MIERSWLKDALDRALAEVSPSAVGEFVTNLIRQRDNIVVDAIWNGNPDGPTQTQYQGLEKEMVEFSTSPKGQIASNIFEQVKEIIGITSASKWMFSANAWLSGNSPIEAIRQGQDTLVQLAVEKLKENKKAA